MAPFRPEAQKLLRYIRGEGTREEHLAVERWMRQSPDRREYVAQLRAIWEISGELPEPESDAAPEEDWMVLQARMHLAGSTDRLPASPREPRPSKRRTRREPYGRRVAAFMVAAVLIALIVFALSRDSAIHPVEEVAYQTITAEPGQRLTLTLSDGTIVELNSASSVTVPNRFGADQREVHLEGEAFFDVAHTGNTFIITTPDAFVRVLGTSFGVRAYADEPSVDIAVTEGEVALSASHEQSAEIRVDAGRGGRLDRESKALSAVAVDADAFLAWRDGRITYQGATLTHVARDLSRRYGLRIITDVDDPDAFVITADLRARHLSDVAAAVTAAMGLRYEMTDDGLRIY